MSSLLAGIPLEAGGATVNRLCGSGMEATAQAARAIRVGEADLVISGGVEKHEPRTVRYGQGRPGVFAQGEIYDTTIGWRFVNPKMEELYGVDAMGQTAENLAVEHQITREDQDAFAFVVPAQGGGRPEGRQARRRDRFGHHYPSAAATIWSSMPTNTPAMVRKWKISPSCARRSPRWLGHGGQRIRRQ